MDIYSTELGIWHRFVKVSEFLGGERVAPSITPPHPQYVTAADVAAMQRRQSEYSITCYIASCEMKIVTEMLGKGRPWL
jgi:hypothetical protein